MKSFYARLEGFIVGLALAFPLLGTFMPIETYLSPNTSVVTSAQQPTESFDFSHLVALGVDVLAAYLAARYARGMLKGMRCGVLLLGLVGIIFVSTGWAVDSGVTLRRAVHFLVYGVFALYLFQKYDILGFTRYITRVLAVPVFASFAILIIRPDLGFSSYLGDAYAVRGAALDKNALGDIMCFALLASGYSLYSGANNRLFAGSVLLGSLVLIALAPSATSRIVAVAMIATAIYAWLIRRRSNAAWGIVGALFTAIVIGFALFPVVDTEDFLKLVGKSSTLTGRTDVWHAVIESIHQRPMLGYGYAFWEKPSTTRTNMWLEIGWATPHAHNAWLDILLQLGVVGLAIVVVLWIVSLTRSLRLVLFTREPGAVFMALILMDLFIRSWTETILLQPAEALWMWFALAYLYLSRMSQDHRARSRVPQHLRRAAVMQSISKSEHVPVS